MQTVIAHITLYAPRSGLVAIEPLTAVEPQVAGEVFRDGQYLGVFELRRVDMLHRTDLSAVHRHPVQSGVGSHPKRSVTGHTQTPDMVVAQGERRGILPHDLDLDTGAGVRIANFRKSAFRGPGPDQSVFRIGQQRIDGIRSQPVRSRIGNGAPAADIVTNQPVHRGDPDVAATVLAQIEEITITAGNVFGNPRQEQQTFPETASGQFDNR